jgi:RNA polymerase sigma-70 factor (ECF subfamily)
LDSKELAKVVVACKKNSRRAKAKLYHAYAPTLLTICLRYARNKTEAEDILHEGFIKIYTKIDQAGKGSFEAWMIQIIKNEALQFLRKKSSLNKKHFQYEKEVEEEENYDEELIVNDISSKKILEMIQELPDGYRLVFNLYVFEEKSHKEIARALEITESTSKSQYFRAKKLLQNRINEYRKLIHR